MSEKERLERHIEYVKYALNSLLVLCYLFLGALWGYYKLLTNWEALTLGLLIVAFNYFGMWALRKVSEQVLIDRDLQMKSGQALTEGKL
jgi:uncharacterized membrane protein YqjE